MKTLFFIPELKDETLDLDKFRSIPNSLIVYTSREEIDKIAKDVALEYGTDKSLDKIFQNEVMRRLGWSFDDISAKMVDKEVGIIIAENSVPKSDRDVKLLQKNFNFILVKDAHGMSFLGTPFADKNEDFVKGLRGSLVKAVDNIKMLFALSYDDIYDCIISEKYKSTDADESIPFFAALFTSLGIPLTGPGWSQGTEESQEADKQES